MNFVRGSGNIFSDDNPFVTYDLANHSQAIGQGKSSIQFDGETITPHGKDFFGNDRPRPAGTNPDMGAVENDLSEPKYNRYTVAQDGTGDFSELSLAINWNTNLVDNDTVIIKPGIYAAGVEGVNFYGKNIIVGSLFLITGDSSYIESTIIDAYNLSNVVTFSNGETNDAQLIEFTLQRGYTGIFIQGSNPTLKNLINNQ